MQPEPWVDGIDVDYAETLECYDQAANLNWHEGRLAEAQNLISSILRGARSPNDKAKAWIIQSRIYARHGNLMASFEALTTCLEELGIAFGTPTEERCEQEFLALRERLQDESESDLSRKSSHCDPEVAALGLVLCEAISAALWNDSLVCSCNGSNDIARLIIRQKFQMFTISFLKYYINHTEALNGIGLAYAYFTMITTRYAGGDLSFTSQMYHTSLQLLRQCSDSSTVGRGLNVAAVFAGHLFAPMSEHLEVLEESVDLGLDAGDKHLFLFAVSSIALHRMQLGLDLAEIEMYCSVAPEDFRDWETDLRGGVTIIACRQLARSLQGKTFNDSQDSVMSDESHSTASYIQFIKSSMSNPDRSLYLYKSLLIVALYSFGYYEKAINVGNEVLPSMGDLFSMRNSRLTLVSTLRDLSTPCRPPMAQPTIDYH